MLYIEYIYAENKSYTQYSMFRIVKQNGSFLISLKVFALRRSNFHSFFITLLTTLHIHFI